MRFPEKLSWQRSLVFCLAGGLSCSPLGYSQEVIQQVEAVIDQASQQEAAAEQINDPVLRNGPIFVDWPKPQVAILFSGELNGYLEPCGCAGLDNQKGGLKRRQTLIRQLEAKQWPVVSFDMGGQIRRLGPQGEIKYRYVIESLTKLGYSAIGLGERELQIDANYLTYVLSNYEQDANPVVSANISIIDPSIGLSSRYRVIQVKGKKIGVTSVLGKKYQSEIQDVSDIVSTDPVAALEELMPTLMAEGCDLLVLLAHADPDEARELSRQFPQFQMVATTGGAEIPPKEARKIEGSEAHLIEVGHKGMYVAVVGLFDDVEQPFRYQRVPLDHRFKDSDEMQAMLTAYQNELKNMGLEGLGLLGLKHSTDSFVGSEVCADCHTSATEVFEMTPHAHATDTLVMLDPPRQYDPECLSCHVTGWEPQEYFPYMSGYRSLEKTPHLVGNGCENCHGPGAAHVAAESGEEELSESEIESLRSAMRLEVVENEGNLDGQELGVVVKNCLRCHDLDNSPAFDFQQYWPKVAHPGKD
ncbi:MAG: hypothetical protein KDA57_04090 [Planctomycetales bacterium]|nr:hypothetical protein [Planctomycetales bacterium]